MSKNEIRIWTVPQMEGGLFCLWNSKGWELSRCSASNVYDSFNLIFYIFSDKETYKIRCHEADTISCCYIQRLVSWIHTSEHFFSFSRGRKRFTFNYLKYTIFMFKCWFGCSQRVNFYPEFLSPSYFKLVVVVVISMPKKLM